MGLRETVEERIDELTKTRLKLSDSIFGEGRTPTPSEWARLEAFDDKIEGLWDIIRVFCKAPEAPASLDPFMEVLY